LFEQTIFFNDRITEKRDLQLFLNVRCRMSCK
jgi:hypothetical protein